MYTYNSFHRYDEADQADPSIAMPTCRLGARASNTSIGELINRFEEFCLSDAQAAQSSSTRHKAPLSSRADYPWADRFVMSFPLPEWQRPLVWSDEQKIAFILSIWNGVDIGSYLINDVQEFMDGGGKNVMRKFSDVLLDGQQRLSAIEDYLLNKFAVPDTSGVPRTWKEIPRIERRRFASTTFTRATIHTWDEELLRYAYDMRAFGGTAHTTGTTCHPTWGQAGSLERLDGPNRPTPM